MASVERRIRLQDDEEIILAFRSTAWIATAIKILSLGLYIPWWRVGWLVLTDHRVTMCYGIFNKSERTLPLRFTQDASVSRSWLGNAKILISTAGGSSGDLEFPALKPKHARQFADATMLQARRVKEVRADPTQPAPVDVTVALTRLASLRESGTLTEEEFAQQKARLLSSENS